MPEERSLYLFASVLSAAIFGVEVCPVQVEADVSNGLPSFIMVGFPSAQVKEAQERVRTALKNMPDTYIDRWIKSGKNGSYFPVWCVVVPPADCPRPRQERPYIASRGLQALSFHH